MLSQDYLFKCWDTSHYPKTSHSSVGTLRTVPSLFFLVLGHFVLSEDYLLKCWDISNCRKTSHSSVGTLRTVPRPFVQVLGYFVLSQDYLLKRWDTSHCPKTFRPSVKTLRAVPRLPAQVFGTVGPLLFWDSRISFSLVLEQSDLLFFSVGTLRSLSLVPPLEL